MGSKRGSRQRRRRVGLRRDPPSQKRNRKPAAAGCRSHGGPRKDRVILTRPLSRGCADSPPRPELRRGPAPSDHGPREQRAPRGASPSPSAHSTAHMRGRLRTGRGGGEAERPPGGRGRRAESGACPRGAPGTPEERGAPALRRRGGGPGQAAVACRPQGIQDQGQAILLPRWQTSNSPGCLR